MRVRLLDWYDCNRRDLPWRRTADPYRVWISEIMLQQTRVGAVLDHYARFLRRFPTVKKLAAATESQVLALWSGLGYYRRARLLHAAARVIVNQPQEQLPRTAEGWRELPGIGRYTAAAIASIAFGEAAAVVDGNVERVLRRLAGTSKTAAWDVAEELLSPARPGDFNQAMMELGATVCLPANPKCGECPWHKFCASRGADDRPARTARRAATASYTLHQRRGRILLSRRGGDESLMPSMWELPVAAASANGRVERFRHAILDTDYHVEVHLEADALTLEGSKWVPTARLGDLPLTGLCRKVLAHFGIL